MAVMTFAYLYNGIEWHRGPFESGLGVQRFAEELVKIPKKRPTNEIRVWDGVDTERAPDAVVSGVL